MGASTKRDDASKIGMFGTGAKYAIAALLREKVPVEIRTSETVEAGQWGGIDMAQTTLKSYRFKTVPVDMRGHLFDQIYLLEDSERKGTPLSFTTEMGGLGWTVEHALRELVSNALDEPEPAIKVVAGSDRSQHAGETAVYVGMTPAVADFWNSIDRWFLFRREPVASGDGWGVYSRWGPGVRVYRKGVLAYEDPSDSAY
ncbi:MAG: hypothetical protein GWN97_02800, partial [Thermoplasmata archaeon]|nr:hypothetical protein [Thermoplasmata archaeon]